MGIGCLADKDIHAQPQFFKRFFYRGTFVVAANAGTDVGIQGQPGESRAVTVFDQSAK